VTSKIKSFNNEALSCAAFEDRVHQILDDRLTLTGDARLMEHAAQCGQCEIKLLDYDSFDDSLSFVKHFPSEATCTLGDDGSVNPLYRPLVGLAGLAVALLVLLNVFGAHDTNRPDASVGFAQLLEDAERSSVKRPATIGHLAMARPITIAKTKDVLQNNDWFSDTSALNPLSQLSDLSQLNPIFQVTDNLPRLPQDWNSISKPFEPLQPVLSYSAELPGVRTAQCTLNVTIELLRRSLADVSSLELEAGLGLG